MDKKDEGSNSSNRLHEWFRQKQSQMDFREVVYLIESPSPEDLLHGRHEGDALSRILGLAGIDVSYSLASTDETFDLAFEKITQEILVQRDLETAMPFIHISAHGSEDGLELTDGDTIHWEKLNKRLSELHTKIKPVELPPWFDQNIPKVSICLSSCSAFDFYVKNSPKPPPYQSVVGPTKDVGWCEALIAFSTFYYQTQVLKKPFDLAVFAMNVASGAVYNDELTYSVLSPHEKPTKEDWEKFAAQSSRKDSSQNQK